MFCLTELGKGLWKDPGKAGKLPFQGIKSTGTVKCGTDEVKGGKVRREGGG